MKALILAGGLGTRLKSVVQDVPKPMAPIRSRPFLEYLLDFWIEQGITEFYMSTCHLAEKIESHFKEEYRGRPLHQIQEPTPLGTGGAVLYALDQIKGSEEMVVVNGDTFFELDFLKMLQFHKEKQSNLTLGLRQVELNDRYSGIQMDTKGQIELFSKRETGSKNLLINAGVYILKPDLFKEDTFTLGEKYSLEDDIFPKLIKKHSVYGFVATGRFIDIGIPNDYAKAQLFFHS